MPLSPSKIDAYKTDIWSLACSIAEMASGQMPFPSQAVAVYQVCIQHKSPKIPDCLSDEGVDFLARCFDFDASERPGAEELRFLPFCDFSEETMSRPEFLQTSNTTTNLMLEELISRNSVEDSCDTGENIWNAETKSSKEEGEWDAKEVGANSVIFTGDEEDEEELMENFGFSDAPTLSSANETLTNW